MGEEESVVALEMRNVVSGYGPLQVLWNANLKLNKGECHVLLGANGAGKSSLLRVLIGVLPLWEGSILIFGRDCSELSVQKRVRLGISFMSEVGVFPGLTVTENLRMGKCFADKGKHGLLLERSFDRFPELKAMAGRKAGSLSGGQRKMLGVAKALIGEPRLVVMDEPSAGLSPLAVSEVIERLRQVKDGNITFLIAEQNVAFLSLADCVTVFERGRSAITGPVSELRDNATVKAAFFGDALKP